MDSFRPYNALAKPSFPANDVSSRIKTELLSYEVDLSTARTFTSLAQPFLDLNIVGNAFFVDQNSDVGNATVVFADQPLPGTVVPVYVQAGFIARVPFTRVMIANTAQAGKKLRFFYGVDIDFVPSINGTFSISGTVGVTPTLGTNGATTDQGYIYGASYKSTTTLAANTPDTVFTPAANANGAIVWDCGFSQRGTPGAAASFIAKNGAPATIIDGDVICQGDQWGVDASTPKSYIAGKMPRVTRIAAGKGLYYISALIEDTTHRHCNYTLL
jgi:hypothetical protein